MSGPEPVDAAKALSPDQQAALSRLHQAATQLEGVFLEMVMHEMSNTVSKDSIYGKQSMSEDVFSGMLDNQRAQAIAKTGSMGIAKALENQLRASVLSDSKAESKTHVDDEVGP
jgi:Rod binding domain-containing protein